MRIFKIVCYIRKRGATDRASSLLRVSPPLLYPAPPRGVRAFPEVFTYMDRSVARIFYLLKAVMARTRTSASFSYAGKHEDTNCVPESTDPSKTRQPTALKRYRTF